MQSILTKNQKITFGPTQYKDGTVTYKLTATVRYDDECNNGHNILAVTGAQYRKAGNGRWMEDSFGCLHEDIAKRFPHLTPLIKFHGMISDGPMYYIENTVYHVLEHGPKYAWVYYKGQHDPLGIGEADKTELLGYVTADIARKAEGQPGYTVKWDEKSAKVHNLDCARSAAMWPDATDEELTAPVLEDRLRERLPALMQEFQALLSQFNLVF